MKKNLFILFIILFITAIFGACALLTTEDPKSIPIAFTVNTNSPYYVDVATETLTFTGDPAADFKATRLLYADPTNDSTNTALGGSPTKQYHEIGNVYFAYTKNNMFIGFKSPEYPDGTTDDLMNAGGSYIIIDNGITSGNYSKGVTKFNNAGLTEAGISGQIGGFDESGFFTTNIAERKISMYIKHYRPVARDMVTYNFISGSVKKEVFSGGSATTGWQTYTANGCTEIQVPLHYIFGDETTNVNEFYIAFRIDGALAENNVPQAQRTNAGAVDWAPSQDGIYITNWITISNLKM